ncbi:hypothetical protein PCANB_001864 [Pneumocystis canis]|nr:hypothetical protein PCK1_002174 [Pneumocystis canis]KAG5440294.1 hypothetical protein PCANB_001864 [Pneumocystis canis]
MSNITRILVFPGQGTQHIGMIRAWTNTFKEARHIMNEIDDILGFQLQRLMHDGPLDKLNQTENAQVAILAASYCIIETLHRHFDIQFLKYFKYAMGHSLGEYTALLLGGVFSLANVLQLIKQRGEWMRNAAPPNTHVVAITGEQSALNTLRLQLKTFTNDSLKTEPAVSLASDNTPTQIVLSGTTDTIQQCLAHFRQKYGYHLHAIPLRVSTPVHSPFMAPVAKRLAAYLNSINLTPPIWHVIANTTARPYPTDTTAIKTLLVQHCTETVQWRESVQYLEQNVHQAHWFAIGPTQTVFQLLTKQIPPERLTKLISLHDIEPFLEKL